LDEPEPAINTLRRDPIRNGQQFFEPKSKPSPEAVKAAENELLVAMQANPGVGTMALARITNSARRP
jgi:hypothetical protein